MLQGGGDSVVSRDEIQENVAAANDDMQAVILRKTDCVQSCLCYVQLEASITSVLCLNAG